MISLIDECVGNIVSQLEALGQLDNTLIVYSSDHGEMLGDHGLMAKFNFYRSSVQVPLIIVPPGGCSPRTSPSLVELVDIGPTLIEAAGAEPLKDVRGRCLLGDDAGHDHVFSEIQKQSGRQVPPMYRAVRDSRYRCTIETTTQSVCELFDLERDPDELDNLIRNPDQRDRIEQFRELVSADLG